MKKKSVGIVSALSIVLSQAGVAPSALAEEAEDLEFRCTQYRDVWNRTELIEELEDLLLRRPDDDCIPVILALLGPAPVAEGPDTTTSY